MSNLHLPNGMRFGTTPEDMQVSTLANRMYGGQNVRGPYFYPKSPYGLGDLVPGSMPTRFGQLKVFPDADRILSNSTLSTASQDGALPQSIGQETGRYDMAQPAISRHNGGITASFSPSQQNTPISPLTFSAPMPSVLRPRAAQPETDVSSPGLSCWVAAHPVLSIGAAVLVFAIFKGAHT